MPIAPQATLRPGLSMTSAVISGSSWALNRPSEPYFSMGLQLSSMGYFSLRPLYASDQPSDFRTVAQQFLREELHKPVLPVDIDRY